MIPLRAAIAIVCLAGPVWLPATGVAFGQSARYAGRPLADVLLELRAGGMNIVFSSELVRPEMRVTREPGAAAGRRLVDELLRPHDLAVRETARGMLTVVRARLARRPPDPAGPPGTVRGRIVDARTGASLGAALVQVESNGQRGLADTDGRFEITGVPAGSHTLLVSLIGYALVRRDVSVAEAGVVELVIPLAEGAGTFVESVIVTASPFRDAEIGVASQSVLGSRDLLALRGVVADDPLRAVQTLPGVATGDDFRAEFAVRGHGPQHLGLSIDGIDSRLLFHTVRGVQETASLALINSDILDSVALVAGSRPQRLHGNLGAAVSFTTRDGASDRVHVRGLLSATTASTVWEGPAGARTTWFLAARQSYLDWLVRKIDPDAAATFGFTDLQAKATFAPSPRHRVRALVLGGRSVLHERDETPGLNSLDTGAYRTVAASLQWQFAASDTVALSQQIYMVGATYRNETPFGGVRQEGSDRDLTWRGMAEWSHGLGRVEAGGQAQRLRANRQDRRFTRTGPIIALDSSGTAADGAVWVHSSWTIAPGFTVSPGARVDHWGVAGSTTASPWLLGEWQISPRTRWRAGVALQHQGPLIEQAERRGAAPLHVERARSLDSSLEHTRGDWRVSVQIYARRERDRLRLVGDEPLVESGIAVFQGSPRWENALDGRASGAGLVVERRSANGLSGWAGYSHDRFEMTDATRGEVFDADYDQRHTLNAYAAYRTSGRMAFSARWRLGSGFPLTGYYERAGDEYRLSGDRNRERLPVYSRLDLRGDRAFTFRRSRMTLFVEVLNVLNRSNQGPTDPAVSFTTLRVRNLTEDLFPILPSAGLQIEF